MKSYVVELQLPAEDATHVAAAAEQLARQGISVRWVRTVHVPEEETCQLVFECERIVEGGRAT